MRTIAPYGKAITAAVVAGLSVLLASSGDLGWDDGLASLIAFLVSGGAVWAIPNGSRSLMRTVPVGRTRRSPRRGRVASERYRRLQDREEER